MSPVWNLALHTPFRLIDDYGQWRLPPGQRLAHSLGASAALKDCAVRFRPVHDVGQWLSFRLFSTRSSLHHALRLAMKLATFAALLAVAMRLVRDVAGVPFLPPEKWTLAAVAMALFFYSPNVPEARLSPQELSTVMYLMGTLLAVYCRPAGARRRLLRDGLGLVCFSLMMWSKEPNFISGAFLLAAAVVERAAADKLAPVTALVRFLPHGLVWTHAALKAYVLHSCGGYGRTALSPASVGTMLSAVPSHVLLGAWAWWEPLVFLSGLGLFAWFGIGKAPDRRLRLRSWLLAALLAGVLAQYLLLWSPVLRYAYPPTCVVTLVALVGLGVALARASRAPSRWRKASGAVTLAVAFAFAVANYGDLVVQFSRQWVTGHVEKDLLEQTERLMTARPERRFHDIPRDEYDDKVFAYFNRFLPLLFGRTNTGIRVARSPEAIPTGDYLITREPSLPGFIVVRTAAIPSPPRIVAFSNALSAFLQRHAGVRGTLTDAGSPGPETTRWFVLQRQGQAPP